MTSFQGITKTINKVNYYQKSISEIEKIKELSEKPSILLHACCAPCACWPIEFLAPYFRISIYYNNSNIYPENEYLLRKNELVKYIEDYNQLHQEKIELIIPPYEPELFLEKLNPLKDYPEGSKRCFYCYSIRMKEAYAYADRHNFTYFCTVMTISRQKNSQKLNEIGYQLAKLFPNTKYFFSDFKKKKGIDQAQFISKEHNLYRQQYCGCKFSYEQYLQRKENN